MTLLRRFRLLTFMLVLISMTGSAIAQDNIGFLLVVGMLSIISWFVTEGPRGRTLPRWVSNLLVIAVTLSLFVDLFHNRVESMAVLGRFAAWLTVIKLYERRTARDHAHLLTLSLLLMLTGCIQANDLVFGAILLIYLLLGLYVVLLYQLQSSFEQSKDARDRATPTGYRFVPPLRPVAGRNARLHFRAIAVGIAVLGVAVSVGVFVGFPRGLGTNFLESFQPKRRAYETRFSWEIDLIRGGRINESNSRVLTLELFDSNGNPIHRTDPIRLRGTVLDRYDGRGHWTTASGRSIQLRSTPDDFSSLIRKHVPLAQTITQRIELNRPTGGIVPLFTQYAPVAVKTDRKVHMTYDATHQTLKTTDRSPPILSYSVRSHPILGDDDLATLSDPVRYAVWAADWTREDIYRLRQLAESVLTTKGIQTHPPSSTEDRWRWNRDAALALERMFQSDEFTYTTDLRQVKFQSADEDPILHFLFHSKQGHCEYYASAMAALCHSLKIPVRVVGGYVASNYDESQHRYTVLERNAHAWVEVGTGPNRWTTFDPTPPATLEELHDYESGLADHVRWAYERFEGNWSASVVGYDQQSQARLAESVNQRWAERATTTYQSIRNWMDRVNRAFQLGPAGYIWMGIVGVAIVIAVIALFTITRRVLAVRQVLHLQHVRRNDHQRMIWQLGFYVDMLAILQRAGLEKPAWQPPLDFAKNVQTTQPAVAKLVQDITDLFYAGRYGRRHLTRTEKDQSNQLLQNLASTLHVKI